jgi:hypothetical protein
MMCGAILFWLGQNHHSIYTNYVLHYNNINK